MSKTKKKAKLTDRQFKAIPHIVSSPTYTKGCKKAKINKTTLYKWLKEPEFKAELDRQRDEIAAEAFGVLSQSLTQAIEALVGLLDNKDDRLKRLAAKDVIDFIIRHKENEDLDKRLTAIEKLIAEKKL
ncbi:phBC6A51 family helix-turn-helix protein [Planctomycetota bacterium]